MSRIIKGHAKIVWSIYVHTNVNTLYSHKVVGKTKIAQTCFKWV